MRTTIGDQRQKVLGAFLVAVALAILFVDLPGGWKYLHLAAWTICWTLGLLLRGGFLGTHAAAVQGRRLGSRPLPLAGTATSKPLATHVFRYGASRWRRAAAASVGVALGLGLLILGAAIMATLEANPAWVGTACAITLGIWGLFLCDYARRYLRVCIRVDEEGIKSQLYYRSIQMRWDEVVAIVKDTSACPMVFSGVPVCLDAQTMYWVYSKDAKIWFSNQLVGGNSLAEILSQKTGLPLEGGGW